MSIILFVFVIIFLGTKFQEVEFLDHKIWTSENIFRWADISKMWTTSAGKVLENGLLNC